jgi:hypothetical protein
MGVIMIRCPRTGQDVPTGIEMRSSDFQRAPVFFARVQCPACGREHEWFAKDAWVSEAKNRIGAANWVGSQQAWVDEMARVPRRQRALSDRL